MWAEQTLNQKQAHCDEHNIGCHQWPSTYRLSRRNELDESVKAFVLKPDNDSSESPLTAMSTDGGKASALPWCACRTKDVYTLGTVE